MLLLPPGLLLSLFDSLCESTVEIILYIDLSIPLALIIQKRNEQWRYPSALSLLLSICESCCAVWICIFGISSYMRVVPVNTVHNTIVYQWTLWTAHQALCLVVIRTSKNRSVLCCSKNRAPGKRRNNNSRPVPGKYVWSTAVLHARVASRPPLRLMHTETWRCHLGPEMVPQSDAREEPFLNGRFHFWQKMVL